MTTRIEHTGEVFSLDIKRCYLPIVIHSTCPSCGIEVHKHLSSDYLSYPKLNVPILVSMYHCIEHPERDEEHDWKVVVELHVTAIARDDVGHEVALPKKETR